MPKRQTELLAKTRELTAAKVISESRAQQYKMELTKAQEELEKIEKKNKSLWATNSVVYTEKKRLDEERELLMSEKQKFEEKNKKLWQNSMALHKEKEEISRIKAEIEHKHTEVTDSILYSKRIQNSILPANQSLQEVWSQSFVLYQPRDIVSGDFYWFANRGEYSYLAVADCTGHGVPGALMSMLGYTQLNDILNQNELPTPAEILTKLDKQISAALNTQHAEEVVKDGMDISLIRYHAESKSALTSAAMRPVYLVTKNVEGEKELVEIKPDKNSIGGFGEDEKLFNDNELIFKTGDELFLFTDGYPDQFGGLDNKKFLTKKFKEMLLRINSQKPALQRAQMEIALRNWKGDNAQTDDICVIGLRIN